MASLYRRTKAKFINCFCPSSGWDNDTTGNIRPIEAHDLHEFLERARSDPLGPEARQLATTEGWFVTCSQGKKNDETVGTCKGTDALEQKVDSCGRRLYKKEVQSCLSRNPKTMDAVAGEGEGLKGPGGAKRRRRRRASWQVSRSFSCPHMAAHFKGTLEPVLEVTDSLECASDRDSWQGGKHQLSSARSWQPGSGDCALSPSSSSSGAGWQTDTGFPTPDSTPATSDSDNRGPSVSYFPSNPSSSSSSSSLSNSSRLAGSQVEESPDDAEEDDDATSTASARCWGLLHASPALTSAAVRIAKLLGLGL